MSEDTPARQAEAVPQVDNERVKVTEWRFAPGAATGFHRHELDYVIVPLMNGRLRMVDAGGRSQLVELEQGRSYFRQAGVEHDVVNDSGHDFAFVEVELKS